MSALADTPHPRAVGAFEGRRGRRRPPVLILVSAAIVGLVVICAATGTLLAPHDPDAQDLGASFQGVSGSHPLGTDDSGRDILSRIVAGARSGFVGPVLVVLGAAAIGIVLGLVAGYRGGWRDTLIMRAADLVFSLPGLLVAIVVLGVVGGGYYTAVAVLTLLIAPSDTRIVRGATLEQRELPYVDAARTMGLSRARIMFRHILPNLMPLVVANAFLNFAQALVALSALSFLGLGVGPGEADWGRMLADNLQLIEQAPLAALAAGAALVVTATSMNLLGDWAYERLSDRGDSAVTAHGPSDEALLRIRRLRISSTIAGRENTIVSGLDLDLAPGETLGIVGESGSGKSMTARAIVGLLPTGVQAAGEIRYRGRDLLALDRGALGQVRGSEIAMIFQDPFTMLNPLMRCGRQITDLLRDADGKRLSRPARREAAEQRLAEVGIHDAGVVDAYPFELSGGMRQRVGIAAALARDPSLVIADEPSTALDMTTQKEILGRLKALQASRGMGLILITHDLRVAFSMCDRIAVLYAGALLEQASAAAIERAPRHPYTLGLLLCEPPGDRRVSELTAIPGSVPQPDDVAEMCRFAPRCRWSATPCTEQSPPLTVVAPGRLSACVRQAEIGDDMEALRAAASQTTVVQPAAEAQTPLVQVSEVRKIFPAHGSRGAVTALDGVSIEVGAGESVGLVGESGSGKTTLGRCLLGLEKPSSGRIVIDGIDASDYEALTTADRRRLRRSVQMVFQDPYSTLNPARTVGATLAEALTAHDPRLRDVRQRVGELLERVGLPSAYATRKPAALSGGQRQRVAVARALAASPKLIVCDEAVSALDVSVQAQILNLLVQVREDAGVSYLFITHDLAVVRQVVDRLYVLCRGEVVESGPADRVLDRPQHAYTRLLVDSVPRAEGGWLGGGSARSPAAHPNGRSLVDACARSEA